MTPYVVTRCPIQAPHVYVQVRQVPINISSSAYRLQMLPISSDVMILLTPATQAVAILYDALRLFFYEINCTCYQLVIDFIAYFTP